MYCVKCKKNTKTLNQSEHVTKNNRHILKGQCVVCGNTKSSFVSNKKSGGFVNTLLNSGVLPEMHLPGYNYAGPGTKLKDRLLKGDKPINKLDAAAQKHDMVYAIFKDKKDRHVADKVLEEEANKIKNDPNSKLQEKAGAFVVENVMKGKQKLGLGKKNLAGHNLLT